MIDTVDKFTAEFFMARYGRAFGIGGIQMPEAPAPTER